ncbi:MAG: class I SAM-dependent methyltransferase [Acidimicrobiales bacterium]
MLDELRSSGLARVLDVGCGTGILTERLARELGGPVNACDFSRGMLQQAAGRVRGPLVQADAQRLPIGGSTMDAVVCTESFHWYPDPDAALAEFHRVLAPGGRLLVCNVNTRTTAGSRFVLAVSGAVGEPARWPSRAEMRMRVERCGLRVVHQRRVVRLGGVMMPTVLTVAQRGSIPAPAPQR